MVQGMILSLNISTNILTSDPIAGHQTSCLLSHVFLFIPMWDDVIRKRVFLPFYRIEVSKSFPLSFRGCFHLSICYQFQIVKEKAMEQVQSCTTATHRTAPFEAGSPDCNAGFWKLHRKLPSGVEK